MMDNPYRVLYIDDDESLLDLCKIYLERYEKFSVEVTSSPSVVLDSLTQARYDAIISDFEMPGMNGIELLRAVRKCDTRFPFILFTGRGREDVVIDALNFGADFYLQKGGDPKSQFAELAHKVRQAVLLKQTERSLTASIHELSQASDRYKALISASNTGAWEYHADTGYLWCSPEYFSMLGHEESDWALSGLRNVEETWHYLLHPDDRSSAIRKFESYLKQPYGMYEQQFRMQHADGHYVWIWSRGRTILDDDGAPTSITVGTHIDITKSKEAEESLKLVNSKLERQTKSLSILNTIISAVNKTNSLNELLQVFMDSTLELFRYDGGGIYLIDDESQRATLVYSKNLPDDFLEPLRTISIHEPPFDSLFVWGKLLVSDDYPAISGDAEKFGIQSIASIPLRAKDRIIGAFNIASSSRIVVRDQDLKILESICAELGNSLLRTQTEEELKRAYDTLKIADEELQEQQEQLLGVAGTIPGAIFQFIVHPDETTQVTYISRRVEELLGYSGDLNGFFSWFTDRVEVRDREPLEQSLLASIRSQSSWRFDGRFIRPSGEIFWFEINSSPVHHENTLTYNGVILDITDRKHAELQLVEKVQELQAAYDVIARTGEELRANLDLLTVQDQVLRESEEKFRTLFEGAGDAIIILDKGIIFDCNHQAETLFRLYIPQLLGKSPGDLAPEFQPDGSRSRDVVERMLADSLGGRPVQFEYLHQHPDGTDFFTEVTLQQIRMQGKMFQQAIIRDISDRKKYEAELLRKNEEIAGAYEEIFSAQQEVRLNHENLIRKEQDLQKTKSQLDDIISFLPDATFVINRDGIVIAWNRAMEELTGIASDQMLGQGDYAYALPFYHEKRPILIDLTLSWDQSYADRYPSIIRKDNFLNAELFIPHFKDGNGRYLWFAACPFSDPDGAIVGAIECIRDISARKIAEQALERRLTALTQPAYDTRVVFDELFDISEIQRLQDEFAAATGVASIITRPDGTPITNPSNFTRLCSEIIRQTKKGCENCYLSDAILGSPHPDGPVVQPCLSGGLWDAGASIVVGDRHIANWLIGQVRDETQTEEAMRAYARVIGADEDAMITAFREVPSMPEEQFRAIARSLFTFATLLSREAYQNVRQARAITDHLRMEQVLRESETRLDQAMSVKNEGYWDWDLITNETFFDDRYYTMAGYEPDEFPQNFTAWAEHVHPDDLAAVSEAIKAYLSGVSERFDIEFRFRHKNGTWICIQSRGKIIERDIHGSPLRIIGTHTDITVRKLAESELLRKNEELSAACEEISATEEELRHQYGELSVTQENLQLKQQQFEDIAKTVPGVLYQFYIRPDGSMGLYYVSSRAPEMFGISSTADGFFERFTEQVDPTDREGFLRSIADATRAELPWHYEGRFIKPSGEQIWFKGISRPVHRGTECIFNGILLDITDRKVAEEDLLRRNEVLSAACEELSVPEEELRNNLANFSRQEQILQENRDKFRLMTCLTRHDIVNALTAMHLFLEEARDSTVMDHIHSYIDRARDEGDRIGRIIKFTSEYGRLCQSSGGWLQVSSVIAEAESEAAPDSIVVCASIPPDIEIFADPIIRKVFSTLIENSVRHGKTATRIVCSTIPSAEALIIRIEDDGIGIAPDEKELIFTHGHGKNSGIGLYIVREFLTLTGLSIQETGDPGKGARFEILVPNGKWRR